MQKIDNKIKILCIVSIIVIVVGLLIVLLKGFNFDLTSEKSKSIELYITKEFDISDIRSITDEVMKNEQVIIQKVEVYGDSANIIARDITEEQKNEIINKVNEKYGVEIDANNVQIQSIPHLKGKDIVKPYIIPSIIATGIILIYMCIRYRELGEFKVIFMTLGITIVSQILLFSIIAITRIPVGRLTISMVITVYILSLIAITTKFENKKIKEKENV